MRTYRQGNSRALCPRSHSGVACVRQWRRRTVEPNSIAGCDNDEDIGVATVTYYPQKTPCKHTTNYEYACVDPRYGTCLCVKYRVFFGSSTLDAKVLSSVWRELSLIMRIERHHSLSKSDHTVRAVDLCMTYHRAVAPNKNRRLPSF